MLESQWRDHLDSDACIYNARLATRLASTPQKTLLDPPLLYINMMLKRSSFEMTWVIKRLIVVTQHYAEQLTKG